MHVCRWIKRVIKGTRIKNVVIMKDLNTWTPARQGKRIHTIVTKAIITNVSKITLKSVK